jgi:uncharacterized small protein (DUF1192 family)
MLDEELDLKTKKPKIKDLSDMSVEELEKYKAELEAEVVRVQDAIQSKSSYLSDADKFFK